MKKAFLATLVFVGVIAVVVSSSRGPRNDSRHPAAESGPVAPTLPDKTLKDRFSPREKFARSPRIRTGDRVAELRSILLTHLAAVDQDLSDSNFSELLSELIAIDSLAAASLVESSLSAERREEFLRELAQSWLRHDADGALAWASQLTETNLQTAFFTHATLITAGENPAAAAAMVERFELAERAPSLLPAIAMNWAKTDLAGALEWAHNQPDGRRNEALARIAFVGSQADPETAALLVSEKITPGTDQEEAAISVLHQWALKDLRSAMAWAERFPPGRVRDRALSELSGIARNTP